MMNKATAVALKFFAIYLIFNALIALPSLSTLFLVKLPVEGSSLPIWMITSAVILATAIIIIISTGLIWKTSESLMKTGNGSTAKSSSVDLDRLLKLALSVMGLFFLFQALIALPRQWGYFQMMREQQMVLQAPAALVSTFLQLGLGCWLIAKPRQWAAWLQKLANR